MPNNTIFIVTVTALSGVFMCSFLQLYTLLPNWLLYASPFSTI
ncbi:MAG: hypothetical protein QW688_07865 [Thermoprotei archaeon]